MSLPRNGTTAVVRTIAPGPPLTPREADVGYWMSRGKTNHEIAIILRISRRTAEKHAENILRKLAVENRVTAALVLRSVYPDLSDPVTAGST